MLKNRCVLRLLSNLLWFNLILASLFWISDGLIDFFLFEDSSLTKEIFFPETKEIWIRSFIFFAFAVQGFIVQSLVDRMRKIIEEKGEFECEKSRESLEKTARILKNRH